MRIIRKSLYHKNSILLNFIFVLILVFLIGFFLGRSQMVSKADTKKQSKYISIRINSGDTLEDIAKKYNNTSYSDKDYIKNLKTTNNLNSDTIYAGNYLIVEQF